MTLVGKDIEQLDTPALWINLDQMDKNISQLAGYMRSANVNWRPHIKGIKIPAIAHKLINAGAIGITCSKLSEAEVMAAGGLNDILIANEIVGAAKIARLVNLRRHADIMVAVDNFQNALEISQAAVSLGVNIRVLIEINIGMNRCGLKPGTESAKFAHQIAKLPGITLSGLMGWEGHVTGIEDPNDKRIQIKSAISDLVETAELCRSEGLYIPIVSCGGTGSYRISANISGITEIQAGGGIFGDLTYQKWGAEIECALFVLSTICSHTSPTHAITDAGRKAMNADHCLPIVKDIPGASLIKLYAEHAVLALDQATGKWLSVGDKISFIVGYEDMTLCLHDQLYGIREGKVEVIWDIQARGKFT